MSDVFIAENSAMLLIDHQLGTMKLIKNIPLEVSGEMRSHLRRPPKFWAFQWS